LKFAAGIFEGASRFQDAIKCLERVRKINPSDEAVKRQINALDASATIAKSGLQQAVAQRTVEATTARVGQAAVNVPDDPALDQLKRIAETPAQRLAREIEEEPSRVGNYLELADLFRQSNKLEEAEKVLAAGRKAIPDDDLLRSAYVEVQLLRLRRAQAHWTRKAELEPDSAEIAEKCKAIEEKLDAYELHERKHRAQSEPSNGEVRLAYGVCLARLGKHDEAIAEFQQARTLGEEAVRTEALHRSGESFEAKGLLKLAERSYQEALKMVDTENQTLINTLHYRLGRVAEASGDLVSAEEHYNEVAANDYTFLDVAERLRALNQKR
jgi:tetratricopeptide (TPR) repeat protein